MDRFSSNPTVSIEKSIDTSQIPKESAPEDINRIYELDNIEQWIRENDYKKVCLQFPDYLLPDSSEIATRLQKRLGQVIYIMGDSAYESCCVDYLTAQHVNSDAIVHFGPRCLSNWTNLIPCLCIYDKNLFDTSSFTVSFTQKFQDNSEKVDVILDTPYIHLQSEVEKLFDGNSKVSVNNINQSSFDIRNTLLYIGKNNRKLLNFQLKYRAINIYYYNPEEDEPFIKNYEENSSILKRRRYLIEKIKESEVFAIIIATVVIENYMKAIDRIKKLLTLNRKKYYIISVGKPTVAKLANFPEMDMYILICCPMSDIFDSRDFHKPLVTPYDIEVALNPKSANINFSYDFNSDYLNEELDSNIENKPDVSLISGNIRYKEDHEESKDNSNEIAVKSEGAVALCDGKTGAGFFATRSFKGLEQKLGQTEVELAAEGRKGIPQQYDNELY